MGTHWGQNSASGGVGWRNVIEKMKANATVAEWFAKHGRHPVHAKGRDLELPAFNNPLSVVEHPLAEAERASGAPRKPLTKKMKHLPVVSG